MKYPATEARPVPVTFGSVRYSDDFQWLEEDSPETLAWQSVQDRLTQDWLGSRAARTRAKALVDAMPRFTNDFPLHAGGRWFRKRVPPGQNLETIEVSVSVDGPWRIVVDLNQMTTGEALSLDYFVPSPDGRRLCFGWGVGGRELAELRVVDVDDGAVLLDRVRQIRACFPAWFPDGSGFYYTAAEPSAPGDSRVYRHVLGEAPVTQAEAYEPSHPVTWPRSAGDGAHFLLMADHLNPRPDYIREGNSSSAWRPFLKGEAAFFRGGVIGDRYYAITNDEAACGRIVSIPLATPKDRSTWRELMCGSSDVLCTLVVVDGKLVLLDLVDTWSRIRVLDIQGNILGEVPLPGRGAVSAGYTAAFTFMDALAKGSGGDVLFPFSSPVQFPALYRVDVHMLEVTELIAPAIRLDAVIEDYVVVSADGARVPYHVIARSDLDRSAPQPTVIHGYGGFAVALVPGWPTSQLAAWVEGGGVLVLAHLRGGSELGPEQWHSGRLRKKQNSFNDVFAVAEDLAARGITTSAQLGVVGSSNGGVMVTAAVTQRPELFRAGIAHVPIADVLGCVRDPMTYSIVRLDYGDPRDAEMSEVLHAWSPYQRIERGVAYPALLLDAGENDVRCPPWHVRKLAARMQPASTAPHPILMRVRDGAGHGSVGQADLRALDIDFLTFFMDQLGSTP